MLSRLKLPFIKSVGILLSGSAVAQLLNALAMPLLSRIYSPESIGALAILSVLLGIAAIVATARFDQALVQAQDHEVDSLSWLVLFIAAPVLLFFLIVIIFWGENIPAWLNAPSLSWSIYWLLPLLSIQVLYLLWVARLNQQGGYHAIAVSRVAQAVVTLSVSVIFGLANSDALGLILGLFVGTVVSIFILVRTPAKLSRPCWQEIKTVAGRYISFPTVVLFSALVDGLAVMATPLWIGMRYGEEAAGYFSLTWRVISIPMILVGLAVSQVFYREVSILFRSDKHKALRLLMKTWMWMLLIGMLPFYVVYRFSDVIFPYLFGQEWLLSGQLAQILAPLAYIMFLNSPTSSIFLLDKGRQILIAFCLSELCVRLMSIFVLGSSLQSSLEYMTILEVLVVIVFNVLAVRRVF
ncbi:oligosaccharide flippase family protein [Mariprofundus erugo]|uniref:oligosaccharide flippase family protein n=1 Tax=Mariprofundus erugo TaxID=2528639 RepID=UPI001EE85DC8|nr:oligosaccharide flippase family protein [Mariprofundus erugo]